MQWSKLEIETEKQAAGIEGAPAAIVSTHFRTYFPLSTFNF